MTIETVLVDEVIDDLLLRMPSLSPQASVLTLDDKDKAEPCVARVSFDICSVHDATVPWGLENDIRLVGWSGMFGKKI